MSVGHARVAAILSVVALAGCKHVPVDEGTKMAPLGSAVTKVTAAADASIAYEQAPPGLDERSLLAFATRRNPKVLEPLAGYAVRLAAEDGHAVVLVCDEGGTRAPFEDVGCTMALDRAAWKEAPPAPCVFTLHVKTTCELPSPSSR